MFSIIGIVVVFGAVVAGYLMEHGNLKVLMQPAELIIILGAAIGTVLVANPLHILKKIGSGIGGAFGGSPFTKQRYSSSQVDKRKAGRLALAIQVAFQELGVFQTSNTKIPMKDEDQIPFENVQIVENINKDTDLKRIVNPMKGVVSSAGEAVSLQEAQDAIQKALKPEIQRHEVSMSMRREGLVVSLKEIGFFDSGSATIRSEFSGCDLATGRGSQTAAGKSSYRGAYRQRPHSHRSIFLELGTLHHPGHGSHSASDYKLWTSARPPFRRWVRRVPSRRQ